MGSPQQIPQQHPGTAEWIGDEPTALWRYLRFLGCPADVAEDLVQEAFLLAIRAAVPERTAAEGRSWLRSTARNLFRNHLRRIRRRGDVVLLDRIDRLDAAWDEQHGPHRAYVDALRECLATLGARETRALEMRYRTGASRGAIGDALGLQPGSVKSFLRRVRLRLKNCVERRLRDA